MLAAEKTQIVRAVLQPQSQGWGWGGGRGQGRVLKNRMLFRRVLAEKRVRQVQKEVVDISWQGGKWEATYRI